MISASSLSTETDGTRFEIFLKIARSSGKMCQNIVMARGWESKDVEAQVESGQAPKGHYGGNTKTAEQIRREQERKGLQLSRTRIAHDLESATNPNHRKSLEAALAHLDKKISDLD